MTPLPRWEARLPRHVRVLSFDVFDTVVFRRLHPDLIVTGTARELGRRLTQLGITPVRLAAPARGLAFEQIAVDVQARGGDFEAPLAETVTRWIQLVAGVPVPDADRLAREIEEFEVGNEFDCGPPKYGDSPAVFSVSAPRGAGLCSARTCI